MNPSEFKNIRHQLDFSVAELARVLDVSEQQVRRYEMPPTKRSARAVPESIAHQMEQLRDDRTRTTKAAAKMNP